VTWVRGLRQLEHASAPVRSESKSGHTAALVFNPKRPTIFVIAGNKAAEPREVPAHGSSSLLNDQVRAYICMCGQELPCVT